MDEVALLYAPISDPNHPATRLLNPGTEDRFVTFLSRPRDRDSDERFTSSGAVIGATYSGGAYPRTSPTELNVSWFRSPPANPDSPSIDGAIARVAIDVSALLSRQPGAEFKVGNPADATGPIIVASFTYEGMPGTVSVSFDDPEISGLDWAVWYIPEPASVALVLFAAVAVCRRCPVSKARCRMHRLRPSLIAAASLAASASASVTTTVDLVDPSDSITQPPPGVIAIDVLVDVSADDVWCSGGIVTRVTAAGQSLGATLVYGPGDEPNTARHENLFNPGTDNRFVTFLSRPRGRDDESRYTNAGAAIGTCYNGGSPIEYASATELDAIWFHSPPDFLLGSDGATARVTLDVAALLAEHPAAQFVVGTPNSASGPIILLSEYTYSPGFPGTANVGRFSENEISGLDWAVWYIPEPASLTSIASAVALFRRRR